MLTKRKLRSLAVLTALTSNAFQPMILTGQQPSASAQTDSPRPGEQIIQLLAKDSKLSLIELQSRIVELSSRIRTVDGHDPEVLSIDAVSANRIRLKAEKPGVTSFTLTDEFDAVYHVEVFVDADVRALQAQLKRLFPGASIEVIGLNGDILLRGWVIDPTEIPRIVEVAKKFAPNVLDQLNVGGVSQVQLEVKVMEVQRAKLREFGFNFIVSGNGGYFASTPGKLATVSGATLPFGGPASVTAAATSLTNATSQFAVIGSDSVFQGFIEAVETNSLAKVMAESALVTNSGRPANMLAGGSFPILVPQSLGTTTIEYRDFGVRVEMLPLVLGNGRLRLDVSPEVSEKDINGSVSLGGYSVPAISVRRVNTQVEMRFGETLMLGGLILQRELETRTKVPFLGDLPWIGSAFSRRRSEVGETEVLIMVTPQMMAPSMAGQLPISGPGTNTESASWREFYVDGFMEVPNYNPKVEPIGAMPDVSSAQTMDLTYPQSVPQAAPVDFPGANPQEIPSGDPGTEQPPLPSVGSRTNSGKGAIQQTSGSRDQTKTQQATGNQYRLNVKKNLGSQPRESASVRSNSGDEVRAPLGSTQTNRYETSKNSLSPSVSPGNSGTR